MVNRIALMTLVGGLGLSIMVGCTASATGTITAPGASAAPTSSPTRTVSFASDVMPLLKSKCSACHSTGGRGAADVEMFDASGTAKFDNIKGHIGDMITQTRTGRMPMGGPPLSTDQISILESWQAQGTPNN